MPAQWLLSAVEHPRPRQHQPRAIATVDGVYKRSDDEHALAFGSLTDFGTRTVATAPSHNLGLEPGQALVLERDASTEYIFPATPAADRPFIMCVFDAEGDERTAEPLALTRDEVGRRPITTTEPQPIADVNVRPPTDAATRGDSA